jgi:hypothetical protein
MQKREIAQRAVEQRHLINELCTDFVNLKDIYSIDRFIPNPAGPQVPLVEVMKKVGSLCTVGL